MFSDLFKWITRIFRKEVKEENTDNLYKPKERLIYKYYNGSKVIEADPLVLYKRHRQVWPDLSTDIKIAASALLSDKETIPAHNKVIEQIRWIFDLVPIEKGGLTEPEAEDLYEHFLCYCDRIKKNSSQSLTSSIPTEEQIVSSPADQPISSSSVCGSTENVSDTAGQGSSL